MLFRIAAFAGLLACSVATLAAPVTYNYTTGSSAFMSVGPGGPLLPSLFVAGGASGSFAYDSSVQVALLQANGTVYRGFTPESDTGFPTSLTNLTGTIGAYTFADPNGATFVSNDRFTGFGATNADAFMLLADPVPMGLPLPPRNITAFQVDGYTLSNVRMLWIESIGMTAEFGPGFTDANSGPATPDFLADENLLGAPPGFAGRLLLDFYRTDDPSITGVVFYNNLYVTAATAPIPEPETYGMLLAGLALLGFAARRRKNPRP